MNQIKYFLFFLSISFVGCNSVEVPSRNEIQGIYKTTDGAKLELKADGVFIAESLPVELFFSEKQNGENFNGSGTWTITQNRKSWDQLPWSVTLNFNKTSITTTCSQSLLISGSGFMENQKPYSYIFIWEDEEGGERYKFIKN